VWHGCWSDASARAVCCCRPPRCAETERCKEFVDGLRAPERGYYDLALDYLEAMRGSPLADKAFRETIDFEIGVTLFEQCRTLPLAERSAELEKPAPAFKSSSPITASIRWWSRQPLPGRRADRTGENSTRTSPASRARRPTSATSCWSKLAACSSKRRRALAVVDAQLNKTQKSFGKVDPSDNRGSPTPQPGAKRDHPQRLASARTLYEIAATYEPDSNRRKVRSKRRPPSSASATGNTNNGSAAASSASKKARCYQELGDYANAMTILDGLASLRSGDEQGFPPNPHRRHQAGPANAAGAEMKKHKDAWAWYEKWESSHEAVGRNRRRGPQPSPFSAARPP